MEKSNDPHKSDTNRKNASRSTGPKNTTWTRLNAVRHGLLARGITEHDDLNAYESLVQRLTATYQPVGDLECFFVERIGFHMLRLRRTARLEAEYITSEVHPPIIQPDISEAFSEVLDPGLPAKIGAPIAANLVAGFQRYETAIENKLYRAINQTTTSDNAAQFIGCSRYVPETFTLPWRI